MKKIVLLLLFAWAATSMQAVQTWIDVTKDYIPNPSFESNSKAYWNIISNARSQTSRCECMEFWNGTFDISRTMSGMKDGKYRLRVQAFYRTTDNDNAYSAYRNKTEKIPAVLYAGTSSKTLPSVYSKSYTSNLANNCWSYGNWWTGNVIYFPNGMESASAAFNAGDYWNELEFEVSGGTATIGIKSTESKNDNWCIFDNFILEYFGEVASPNSASVLINEIQSANIDMYFSDATNFDGWMELYNPSESTVLLDGCYLSDNAGDLKQWRLPDGFGVIPAKGFRVVWFDHHELNAHQVPFKLNLDGGTIYLSDASGNLLVSQNYPAAIRRTSYARTTDGTGEWKLTSEPTLGKSNTTSAFAEKVLETPVVSHNSQLFKTSLAFTVTIPEGTTLRYTTDGTTPTLTNGKVSANGSFTVNATTNYRFRLFKEGSLPSDVVTRSYIRDSHTFTIPVLSVVTADDFLYGDQHGVMVQGTNGKPGHGQSGPCNWNMDWERPVNFSYMTPEGTCLFSQDVNLEMCGGWSRAWTPHSFKLKANKVYGTGKTLDYPFFEDKPYIRNRTLQIRNGGNDNVCRFKDPALEVIIQRSGIDMDLQCYQPVVHYINGKYIGVINMREPNNKHFVFANYGWDDDEIDQFEIDADSGYVQKCGTEEAFLRWYELSKRASDNTVYEEIKKMVDIDEYLNYMALELWLGGDDWPKNNLKGFYKREGGKWRFVSFDLDFAFNTSDSFNAFAQKQTFTFDWLYNQNRQITQEIKMVTIFLNMLKNEDFRQQFIDTYCIMGGSVFETKRAQAIIDELANIVKPMMAFENGSPMNTANAMKNSLNNWKSTMTNTIKRYSPMGLTNKRNQRVILNTDSKGAKIIINNREVPYAEFDGYLFAPVVLKAVAPAGNQFIGWKDANGTVVSTDAVFSMPTGTVNLTACFSARQDMQVNPVVINEISASNNTFVNDYFKRNDWVELYNTTSEPVDVSGMYLSDDESNPQKYKITAGNSNTTTVIPAYGHLIVWCDKLEPVSQLHASFKLSGTGGSVTLSAADNSWQDVLRYPAHDMDVSVGRYPDGGENVYVMNVQTIGKTNMYTSYLTAVEQSDTGIRTVKADGILELSYLLGYLKIETDEELLLTIHSISGQEMMSRTLASGRHEIPLNHLTDGCYIAKARNAKGESRTCKFVLTR